MSRSAVSHARQPDFVPVTVALLAYEQERTIEQALDSLLKQSYPIDQLIVSDDCSKDATWACILGFFERFTLPDEWCTEIVLRRNPRNLGLIEHNRMLFGLARNELFLGHAGDDSSLPHRLQRIVDLYLSLGRPRDFLVHTQARVIDHPQHPVFVPPVVQQGLGIEAAALAQALHIGATCALTRSLWNDFGGIAYTDVFEDLVLGFRAMLRNAHHYIPEPLLDYRLHGGLSDPAHPHNAGLSADQAAQRVRALYAQRLLDAAHVGRQDLVELLASAIHQLRPPVAQAAAAPTQASPPPLKPWLGEARWLPGEQQWAEQALQQAEAVGAAPNARIVLLRLPPAKPPATPGPAPVAHPWVDAQWLDLPALDNPERVLTAANSALLDSQADWVGCIEAGDLLADDAVFRVTMALREHPQWQLLYTDEDTLNEQGEHLNPHCKPDFNLDYLRSLPYVGGLLLLRRDLFEAIGGFDPEREGAEDYDLLLRAWEHLQRSGAGEAAIGHVPAVLYHRRVGSGHTRKDVPALLATAQQALQAHFERLGIAAQAQPGPFAPAWRVRWPLPEDRPAVSIVLTALAPQPQLQRCVESIIDKTRYPAYEILIVHDGSGDEDRRRYLQAIASREAELGGRLRVLQTDAPSRLPALLNAGARAARGAYLLMLDGAAAALHEDWLDEMMGHALRPDVGVVGAKLLHADGTIAHSGLILGIRGIAGHAFVGRPPEDRGYFGRAQLTQELSAVSASCMLVRKSLHEQLGGFEEGAGEGYWPDVDFCLRARRAGLRVVFTPYALLLHEGTAQAEPAGEKAPVQPAPVSSPGAQAMYDRWLPMLARDPAYNRQLSLVTTDFLLDDQPCLAWDPEWRPRPRILVHPADREGCGEYRIIAPMRALNRAGVTQGWETMRLFDPAEMERIDADSLVVQRQMEWPQIEALQRHARYSKAFRIFEIDDLITNLPVKSVHKAQIHKDIAKRFRKSAGLCNRLVVATEPLAKAYAGFSDEVVVCPNYLEGARWKALQPARAERKRPRVGWAGGVGHSGDLELIVDVVRETAAEVDWVFFGLCPESLKGVVKELHGGVPLDQYAPKLASLDLDLAVAPLEFNAFNESKSHLRLLEYGILGYPVICSDITPYQGDFPVVRVANRFRDWVRAIRDAVAEPQALRAQGDALRAKVLSEWIMEDHLDRWLRAWTA